MLTQEVEPFFGLRPKLLGPTNLTLGGLLGHLLFFYPATSTGHLRNARDLLLPLLTTGFFFSLFILIERRLTVFDRLALNKLFALPRVHGEDVVYSSYLFFMLRFDNHFLLLISLFHSLLFMISVVVTGDVLRGL